MAICLIVGLKWVRQRRLGEKPLKSDDYVETS
jgi:hypothetical protein